MRIWIDITNSPHVLFFEPLIRALEASGNEIVVTAREYAQTVDLLHAKGIEHHLIGHHRGRSRLRKAWGLLSRSVALVGFGAFKRFDVAFSHNSNDLAVAAWVLRLPHLIVHDYEHANLSYKVNARLATRILVPDAIPFDAIVAHGARPERVAHFPGLKEHVYLSPDSGTREDSRALLGIPRDAILVIVRPPATMSAYHPMENDLLGGVIERLGLDDRVRMVVLPRTVEQRAEIAPSLPGNAMIPRMVLDGPSLIAAADLVVSAGGTMNREAVAMGVPAYTVFAGTMGAVDADLVARGALVKVTSVDDIVVRRRIPHAEDGWWVDNRGVILDELAAIVRGDAQ